ncbi:putative uncharacterized transposon-derived protein F54H12.3 [Trichonephila clavata]|uniref:Uncharacterized transposon-derived protein F54H12.3 n=2 Tax=Trichonephila clavata TaxID=2740835 RepID=A0A8X6HBG6_TRICU|nr:putative uncharacterized transposon-derived protein F54H12.3 [Trichonephila clavata]
MDNLERCAKTLKSREFTRITKNSTSKLDDVERLKKLYYDPKEPASFGGVKRLTEASGLKKSRVKNFLSGEDCYSLHFPVRYKFQRRKTIAYGVNELWQSDLVDLQKLSRFNKGYRYILTIIDVMSRYLRVYPIKDKKANTIAKVFSKIFKEVKPKNIQTDKGSEFYNKRLSALFKKRKVHHYSTKSEAKCAILERAHRTLKNRMYRVFTYRNSYKYLDILQHLVDSYNHSVHRSHGFAPANVTEADEPLIYKSLYNISSPIKFRFLMNDVVRISKARKVFKKGYLPGWTEETFTIYKRYPTNPPTYVLQDLSGKEIAGRFYAEELQKINKTGNDFWAIEKIIRTKGRGSSRQLLVKWVGFDDSFNSWIKAEWLKT